jgi:hypothetical protein
MELFKMWLISWNQAFYNVYKDNISISMFFWANTVGQRPPAIYIYIGMYICWFASCGGETISVYSDHRCSVTQNRVPVPSVTFELSSAQWWALPSWRPPALVRFLLGSVGWGAGGFPRFISYGSWIFVWCHNGTTVCPPSTRAVYEVRATSVISSRTRDVYGL